MGEDFECYVCGSTEAEYGLSGDGLRAMQCANCGRTPAEAYDDWSPELEAFYHE